jgi:hypothetical protein
LVFNLVEVRSSLLISHEKSVAAQEGAEGLVGFFEPVVGNRALKHVPPNEVELSHIASDKLFG